MRGLSGPSDDPRTSMAGRQLGRYEVLTQLASGGMAGVYIARAQGVAGFERLVAVKVLHPHLAHEEEFITMFLDEARLAARIRHPNVVPTLDISDSHGAGYFLVMDYVEGDHLGALLRSASKAGGRLPPPVVARIIMEALGGLDAAHQLLDEEGQPLHLVHRDISPHNILVGVDGIARLTDFGVAKAEVRLSSTREGQFKGKLGYMSPEHASTGHADQRSDLFSMGIVLWESLASRRLFRAENNAATLHKILSEPIPPISSVVPELSVFDQVLARALARPPDDRFQSADEFLEALEQTARPSVGVATAKAVAQVVHEFAGPKIEREAERVKQAIDTYGRSALGEAPLPTPSDGSGSEARPLGPDAQTVAAKASAHPGPGSLAPRKGPRALIAVLAAGLVLGLVAYMAGVGQRSDPASPAAEPPVTSTAAVPAPEPAPVVPIAAAPVAPDAGEPVKRAPARAQHKNRRRRPQRRRPLPPEEDDVLANPYRR